MNLQDNGAYERRFKSVTVDPSVLAELLQGDLEFDAAQLPADARVVNVSWEAGQYRLVVILTSSQFEPLKLGEPPQSIILRLVRRDRPGPRVIKVYPGQELIIKAADAFSPDRKK